jgi:hypothetical protein
MNGLIDGSLSTLAPIFAVALATHRPQDAFLAGLHTLPFLISQYRVAVLLALAAMASELLALAWIRRRFFGTGFLRSFISITLAGVIIAARLRSHSLPGFVSFLRFGGQPGVLLPADRDQLTGTS